MLTSWSWLFPWQRSRARRAHTRVVLYTRRGCHLCDNAWKVLESAQKQFGFVLEAVDVDRSADLVARYGDCVPVVTVDNKLRFRCGVNPVLLERLLRAAERPQARG